MKPTTLSVNIILLILAFIFIRPLILSELVGILASSWGAYEIGLFTLSSVVLPLWFAVVFYKCVNG